jgi:hypothetical protein
MLLAGTPLRLTCGTQESKILNRHTQNHFAVATSTLVRVIGPVLSKIPATIEQVIVHLQKSRVLSEEHD